MQDTYPVGSPAQSTIPLDSPEWGMPNIYVSGNVPPVEAPPVEVVGHPEIITEVPPHLAERAGQAALSGEGIFTLEPESHESPRDHRNKILFAPKFQATEEGVSESPKTETKSFDYLFDPDYEPDIEAARVEPVAKKHEWVVTDKTREEAKNKLLSAARRDKELVAIIQSQAGEVNLNDPLAVVDAIRTKADFRLKVGSHYLQMIDSLARIDGVMPERIVRNAGKRPDRGEYPVANMTSREYAAMLCLAKLDGTFDADAISPTDYIEHNNKGETIRGQHRMAADIALG